MREDRFGIQRRGYQEYGLYDNKDFNTKKDIYFLLLLMIVFINGCYGLFQTLVANQDEIFLTIKENFVEYLPYEKKKYQLIR